jgi:RecA-family ATPase
MVVDSVAATAAETLVDYHHTASAAGAECLTAALDYLALGWSVLCLCPPDHVGVGKSHRGCGSPGKRPLADDGRWKDWQSERASPERVRQWWDHHPNANVGIALGPVSGLVRLDTEGEAGEARLLEVSGGDLPPTLEFASGGGGRGRLYALPPGVEAQTSVDGLRDDEMRIQGLGAQTVLPPSRHASGGRYEWLEGRGPTDLPATRAPAWLLARLSAGRSASTPIDPLSDGEVIAAGNIDRILASMAGSMRRRGFSEEAMRAALEIEIASGRCEKEEGKRAYDATDAERIARSIARYEPDAYANVTIKLNGQAQAANGEKLDYMGLKLTVMSDLYPQPLRWLVPGYLPLGKLVLLAGDGGHGKSAVTLDVAAKLSRGRIPFGLPGLVDQSSALLVSCEDDWEDTILPRLMSADADLTRVYRVDGVELADGKKAQFSLIHYEAIEAELERRPEVKLVVIDPAGAFIGRSGIDDHKDSELRALLGPLTELAARRAVTMILVKHLNKGASAKAIHKVGGSTGYVNAVRAAMLIAPTPDDDKQKLFMPLKFNLGPKPSALAYRLSALSPTEQAAIINDPRCSKLNVSDKKSLALQLFRVEWLGDADVDVDEVMAARKDGGEKCQDASEWLLGYLSGGPVPSKQLIAEGCKAGHAERTIWRAKKDLGKRVTASKTTEDGVDRWVWKLCVDEEKTPELQS